jgi:hypothetical protein
MRPALLRRLPFALVFALVALPAALVANGCRRHIGDGCGTNTDCSLMGERQCDTTQLQGYCTIPECYANSCPDNALCVEFESQVPRRARRYCVSGCERDGDCRFGYHCVRATVNLSDPCPATTTPGEPAPPCTRQLDTPDAGRLLGYCIQNVEPDGG